MASKKPYRDGCLHWYKAPIMGSQTLCKGGRFMRFGKRTHKEYMHYLRVKSISKTHITVCDDKMKKCRRLAHMPFLKEYNPSVIRSRPRAKR